MPDDSLLKKLETDLSTGKVGIDVTRGVLHREKARPVANDWADVPTPEPADPYVMKRSTQKTFFKKLFIGSCVFAFVAACVFVFSLFFGRARLSGENVQLTVQAKTFADSGEEVNVRVSITNENSVPMELAKLVFSYPVGNMRDPNALQEVSRNIGTVAAGQTHDETYSIKLFGEQGTEKILFARVEYRLESSNAIFETTGEAKLALRSSIATIAVNAADTILPGQPLPIQVSVSGNTTQVVENAMVVGDFPDGCEFVSSDPTPTLDNNIWYLGNLEPASQRQISVILSCTGVTNAEKNIIFTLGSQDSKNERKIASIYNGSSHLVRLSSAFLATALTINGRPVDKTSSLSQNRESTIGINWQSMVDTPITDAQIRVKISGSAFDPTKFRATNGFFDSATNTLIWTPNEFATLKNVGPEDAGTFSFSLTPRSGLTTQSTLDLAVSVDATGFGGIPQTLVDATVAKIPVVTDLQVLPKILYHSGLLTNTGPMPMRVGKETTFTIVWQLANSTNSVSDVVVKTTLPTGITWKNVVAPAAAASAISYNEVTREIVWNAGNVGVGQDAQSISFKLAITPVTSQVNLVPNLTNEVTLTGKDLVTGTVITQSRRPLNTRLVGDTSAVGIDGKVLQ